MKVRLVKGAYWDYETVHARLQGWPVPVYERKWESDASYERVTKLLMENSDAVRLAIASHNIRSIAHALALSEEMGLPARTVEFQVLYGMAVPLRRALIDMGQRVRVYTPYGELIPGMAYLVRRLLENTSNTSFLRQGFAEGESPERLLRNPADVGRTDGDEVQARNASLHEHAGTLAENASGAAGTAGDVAAQSSVSTANDGADVSMASPMEPRVAEALAKDAMAFGGWGSGPEYGLPPYRNEPHADFRADAREKMHAAFHKVRAQLGQYHPLLIGDEEITTDGEVVSVNPSKPDEIVGRTARALPEHTERAVETAKAAFPAWRDTPTERRVAILRKAAQIMREQRYELAALIALENGKPWREADGDVTEAIDFIEWYSRAALRMASPIRMAGLTGEINYYMYEPRGVAAVIAPWNFPLAILTGMSSAALGVRQHGCTEARRADARHRREASRNLSSGGRAGRCHQLFAGLRRRGGCAARQPSRRPSHRLYRLESGGAAHFARGGHRPTRSAAH